MALPILPVVANAHLQAQLDAVHLNLALPITEEMVHRAAECLRLVEQHDSLATSVEHGQFILFLHEIQHAQQSCKHRTSNSSVAFLYVSFHSVSPPDLPLVPGSNFSISAGLAAQLSAVQNQLTALQGNLGATEGHLGATQEQLGVTLLQLGAINGHLEAIIGAMDNMKASIQRSHNASATQLSHTLVFPLNAANEAMPAGMWVPRTLRHLLCMSVPRATALLQYYHAHADAPIPNDVELCRKAVAVYLGVRLA